MTERQLSRRSILKGAGSAAGVAALGVGSQTLDPVADPVGGSEALAPLVAAGLVIAGGGAGYSLAKWKSDTQDVDQSAGTSAIRDQIYQAFLTMSENRKQWRNKMRTEYINRPTGESLYARTAWSEVRAAAAEKLVNGKSTSVAINAANSGLNKATRRAATNIIRRYSTAVLSIGPHLIADNEEGINSVGYGGSNGIGGSDPTGWDHPSEYETSGGQQVVARSKADLPGQPSDIGESEEPDIYAPIGGGNQSKTNLLIWNINSNEEWTQKSSNSNTSVWGGSGMGLYISHPNKNNYKPLDTHLYHEVLNGVIYDEYTNISGNISTYVNNLDSGLSQGTIDPSNIYSPNDIVKQFGSSNKRSRLAAELAAAGVTVPKETSFRATISHNDLQASELTCDLYVSWDGSTAKSDRTMEPKIIPSADYTIAYIGYDSSVNGNYITEVLSGNSDLEIISLSSVDGSSDASDSANNTAGSNGEINLGSDPPDEIQNPGNYQSDFVVQIETDSNGTVSVPVSKVNQSGGDYVVPAADSPLSGDETLNEIKIIPKIQNIKTTDYVADPSTASGSAAQTQLELQEQIVSSISDLEDAANGGGGGGLLGGGLPSLPGLTTAESAGVAGLALLGWSALT